jgi:hypothetical protein
VRRRSHNVPHGHTGESVAVHAILHFKSENCHISAVMMAPSVWSRAEAAGGAGLPAATRQYRGIFSPHLSTANGRVGAWAAAAA